jgi:PEP-CTERM motif
MKATNFLRKDVESVKALVPVALLGAALALQPLSVHGQIINLADQNSFAQVNVGGSAGMFNWIVDGVDQLNQQWFWFRVGNVGPEQSINTISAPVISTPNARTLYTTYNNGTFSIQVDYTLSGGLAGSGVSDIAETIRISNLTGGLLDFHFFQYSDFDLAGTAGGDTVALSKNTNPLSPSFGLYNTATQIQGPIALTETVLSPGANHGEVAPFAATFNKLSDGLPDNLNDASGPAGPGDVTWALQWDFVLNPGDTFLISKDKRIELQAIPEPSALALVALGLMAWGLRKRGNA